MLAVGILCPFVRVRLFLGVVLAAVISRCCLKSRWLCSFLIVAWGWCLLPVFVGDKVQRCLGMLDLSAWQMKGSGYCVPCFYFLNYFCCKWRTFCYGATTTKNNLKQQGTVNRYQQSKRNQEPRWTERHKRNLARAIYKMNKCAMWDIRENVLLHMRCRQLPP